MARLYHLGTATKAFEYPFTHDEDDKKFYRVKHRPPVWTAGEAYTEDRDEIIPPIFNGFSYPITSGGTAHAVTEPTWGTITGEITTDNDVEYTAAPYDFLLAYGDSITASIWLPVTDVVLDGSGFTADEVFVRVTAVPVGATKLTLTNRITVLRANADVEQFDLSQAIKIKVL